VAANVKRFIFISSIKVNGESTLPGKPFTADDQPRPEDPYSLSKWEAEVGLHQLANETAWR
jgi:nucleoside-diphosphate-sugar epimerase